MALNGGGISCTALDHIRVNRALYQYIDFSQLFGFCANLPEQTGADMNILLSDKRPVKTVDYGWVGDVKQANGGALAKLINEGVVPVIAPLTHDGMGHILNTNADTMAGETAKALAKYFEVTLVYCFEKEGVLRDENDDDSVIPEINRELYASLKEDGIVVGGMIPKLDNSFATLDAGVKEVIITKADNLCDLTQGTHVK